MISEHIDTQGKTKAAFTTVDLQSAQGDATIFVSI